MHRRFEARGHLHRDSSYELPRPLGGTVDQDSSLPGSEDPTVDANAESDSDSADIRKTANEDVDITPRGSPRKNKFRQALPALGLPLNPNATTSALASNSSNSSSEPASAKRRKQILARLGLKGAATSSGSNYHANATDESAGSGAEGDGEYRIRRSPIVSERDLRRRFSMGTLRLAERVRGRALGVFGGSESESEDVDDGMGMEGDMAGWSSGGSNRG